MWRRRFEVSGWTGVAAVLLAVIMVVALHGMRADASSWSKGQVDEGAEFVSLAFDGSDAPHLAYAWGGEMKYAQKEGGVWQATTLGPGSHPSLALTAGDRPRIAYYDWENDDLKYASWTGEAWSVEVVESTAHALAYASLALDSFDNPHISYADRDEGILKYATAEAGDWVIEVVDNGMSSGYEHSSIALDRSDVPHIAYRSSADLKYASRSGGSWSSETVDSAGSTGGYCSLAFDSQSRPHISYWSYTDWTVRYATRPDGAWEISDVGGGSYSSLALDRGDHPHVVYWGDKETVYSWHDGTRWNAETVGETGIASSENWRFAIATNSQGRPSVAYWGDGVDFTYAVREAVPATSEILEGLGGELSGADGTTLAFPDGCFTDTAVITYTPSCASMTGELAGTAYAFDLTAVYSDTGLPAQLAPGQRYTTVIGYTNIGPVIENDSLGLYWLDETAAHWSQEGVTSTVDVVDNLVTAEVDHFSLFALLGETRRVFLPLVVRSH